MAYAAIRQLLVAALDQKRQGQGTPPPPAAAVHHPRRQHNLKSNAAEDGSVYVFSPGRKIPRPRNITGGYWKVMINQPESIIATADGAKIGRSRRWAFVNDWSVGCDVEGWAMEELRIAGGTTATTRPDDDLRLYRLYRFPRG
uniref:NAC domain-containing protein n=1 Tax=Oryza rufipogon TaxID=4529 RepID=A0A0E0QEC6_ORYRU